MKATATRESGFRHTVKIRSHELAVDERAEVGGDGHGPSPQELLAASLASCTAVTMEMYAAAQGLGRRRRRGRRATTRPPSAAAPPASTSSCGSRTS